MREVLKAMGLMGMNGVLKREVGLNMGMDGIERGRW